MASQNRKANSKTTRKTASGGSIEKMAPLSQSFPMSMENRKGNAGNMMHVAN